MLRSPTIVFLALVLSWIPAGSPVIDWSSPEGCPQAEAVVFREGWHWSDDALMHVLMPDGTFLEPTHVSSFDLIAAPDGSLTVLWDDGSEQAQLDLEPFGGGDLVEVTPFEHARDITGGDYEYFYPVKGAHFAFVFIAPESAPPEAGIVAEVADDGELLREVALPRTVGPTESGAFPQTLPQGATAGPDGTIYVIVDELLDSDISTLHAVAPAP